VIFFQRPEYADVGTTLGSTPAQDNSNPLRKNGIKN
jgi:hypothetical protein